MNEEYEVRLLIDDIYQVIDGDDSVFQGTLPEVNAWLQLKEKGYL